MQNEVFFRVVQSDLKNLFSITRYFQFSTRCSEIWKSIFHFPHYKNWKYLVIPKSFFKSDCSTRKSTILCVRNRFLAIFLSFFVIGLASWKAMFQNVKIRLFWIHDILGESMAWLTTCSLRAITSWKVGRTHVVSGVERDLKNLQSLASYFKSRFSVFFPITVQPVG